jgi:CheY-like chemotaxis protein
MEQVIVNLVLNARDAMALGGRLSIETTNINLDAERIAAERLVLDPGEHVMLAITDTGVGMDPETRARAFEPFFTTKAKGKGTGLGLSSVYGIVEQSGGAIYLDTAPGRGTSVRIYLPVTTAADEQPQLPEPNAGPSAAGGRGTETLLLVEDNDAVRELAADSLRKRGYTVYEARNAKEAIEWSSTSKVKPDLLVTDVVMPGLSGPNLAQQLLQTYPTLHVLYISGYADEAAALHGAFWGDVPLLQKPFTPGQLAERVRMAIDAASGRT